MPKRRNDDSISKSSKKKTYDWNNVTSFKFDSNYQSALFSMGSNMTGQLGLGESVDEEFRPAKLEEMASPVVQISCGGMHTCALLADSSVVTFGCNDDGALGRPAEEFEEEGLPTKVEIDLKAVQIAAGDNFTAVLTENGRVFLCGTFRNKNGNFGLLSDGEVKEANLKELPMSVPVKKISAGYNHLALLTVDGDIYTLGSPEAGQLGRIASYFTSRFEDRMDIFLTATPLKNTKLKNVTDIWCGGRNTFFQLRNRKDDLVIYGCGINNYGQLGIDSINDEYAPVEIKFFSFPIKQVSVGDHHSLFLAENGDLYASGRNVYGQLGVDEKFEDDTTFSPVKVDCGIKFLQCACGPVSSFGLGTDGVLYSWGATSSILGLGQMDDKMFISKPTPIEFDIPSGLSITQISASGIHACLLCTNLTTEAKNLISN